MLRLSTQPAPRVEQLATIVERMKVRRGRIQDDELDDLRDAYEAGALLLSVPKKERRAWREAVGLSRSTASDYTRVAENWPTIQRAGCTSIRAAKRLIPKKRASPEDVKPTYPLPFGDPLDPDQPLGRCINVELHGTCGSDFVVNAVRPGAQKHLPCRVRLPIMQCAIQPPPETEEALKDDELVEQETSTTPDEGTNE